MVNSDFWSNNSMSSRNDADTRVDGLKVSQPFSFNRGQYMADCEERRHKISSISGRFRNQHARSSPVEMLLCMLCCQANMAHTEQKLML
jgi:hypothetical protein